MQSQWPWKTIHYAGEMSSGADRLAFWRTTFHFDRAKVAPWLALRNTIGIGVPLAVLSALGHPASGLVAATGALNVAFSDGSDPYRHRLRRMCTASVLCSFAVLTGGLCGRNYPLTVLLVAACGFAAGMLVAFGPTPTDIGNVTLVTLIVYSAQNMTAGQSLSAGLAALGGGLLQTALALAMWPFGRYGPERQALAALYRELARVAGAPPAPREAPPASAESTQANMALAALGANPSLEAERHRLLLSQAERIRLSLLTLVRLRVRIGREEHSEEETRLLDQCLEWCAVLLARVADALLDRSGGPPRTEGLAELNGLIESVRRMHPVPAIASMLSDARWQLDGMAGQIRSALELAAHVTPAGSEEFERREAAQPWMLRLSGFVAVMRANLSLQSAVCRHAVRLSVSVTIAEVLIHSIGIPRSYWMPMTIAIVLRPDFTTTFTRGVLRVAGTLIGLALATVLFRVLAPTGVSEEVMVVVFAFLLRLIGPANYGVFAINLTAMVVMMFALIGVQPGPLITARGLTTLGGGVIALAAYGLWPTWERKQVPEAVARMLDAYRSYFQTVRDAYLHPDASFVAELDRTRQGARLGRSNAETSVQRLSNEPGVPRGNAMALQSILASAHRLVHAIMSLESGLVRSRPVPAREALRTFGNHVDVTLYYLAAALRGSPVAPESLPDLREDYHTLVESGDAQVDRYALVNVEADRITNSLNTLSGELLAWIAKRG